LAAEAKNLLEAMLERLNALKGSEAGSDAAIVYSKYFHASSEMRKVRFGWPIKSQ
jgi:hypothetical protein